jgi:hypothetical protein
MRCLLDKVTARFAVQGLLKLAEGRELTERELFTLDHFARSQASDTILFISPPSANVARRLGQLPSYTNVIDFFLGRVEEAVPARYFRRWARRLREHGFTREDAAILALATFGTDQAGTFLGMHEVVTYDQRMIHHWSEQEDALWERLDAMRRDLPEPYCQANLPKVLRPEQSLL